MDIVGLLLQAVANYSSNPTDPASDGSAAPSGATKRVQSGGVEIEYAIDGYRAVWEAKKAQLSRTIGDDLPAGTKATLERYRRPIAV